MRYETLACEMQHEKGAWRVYKVWLDKNYGRTVKLGRRSKPRKGKGFRVRLRVIEAYALPPFKVCRYRVRSSDNQAIWDTDTELEYPTFSQAIDAGQRVISEYWRG